MAERVRHFTLIFYGNEGELCKLLRVYSPRIAHYAYILHDKDCYLEDIFEDDKKTIKHNKGDIEKAHFHVLISFHHPHTFTAVKKLFTTEVDKPRVEVVRDMVAQYRYLTHKDNPEKYQYPDRDIESNDINYYEKLTIEGQKRDTDNIAESIINDLIRGVSPRLMVSRYGRDFIIHMKQYQECADLIKQYDFQQSVYEKNQKLIEKEMEKVVEQLECPFDD